MDENSFIERMRWDADRLDAPGPGVDTLVRNAVQQGRRRRARRRVAGGVGGLVAAGLLVTVLATLAPTALRSGPTGVPAGPAAGGTAAPTPTRASTPSPTPTRARPDDRVEGGPARVRATLTDLLPDSMTVTRATATRNEGTDGFAWENNTSLTVRDDGGTSYLIGGIGNGHYTDGCLNLSDCTTTDLPGGGTLWITSSPGGDKAGEDRSFRYNRPDGGHVWLMQRTYAAGNGPVTRDALPLADRTGRSIVTDHAWDALFGR